MGFQERSQKIAGYLHFNGQEAVKTSVGARFIAPYSPLTHRREGLDKSSPYKLLV
jgi:hypothetical protein